VARLGEFLKTSGSEPRLMFARGAVLVFFSQLAYMLALMMMGFVVRWAAEHHHDMSAADRGILVVVMVLTIATALAQLAGLWQLFHAVRPWAAHSIPAILTILLGLGNLGLLALVVAFLLPKFKP
jgi:hypothetical protein